MPKTMGSVILSPIKNPKTHAETGSAYAIMDALDGLVPDKPFVYSKKGRTAVISPVAIIARIRREGFST